MKKKEVEKLDEFYGSFFKSCGYYAVSPYRKIFELTDDGYGSGVIACIGLTLLLPVLPVLTLITASIALVGAIIGMLSAPIVYPFAQLVDACSEDEITVYAPAGQPPSYNFN